MRKIFTTLVGVALVVALAPLAHATATNDEWANRTVIRRLPGQSSIDTSTATSSADDPPPGCGSDSTANSVWYSFTPSSNMRLEASTLGSAYDTILSVFTGSPGSFSRVACNDDSVDVQSQVFLDAQAGQEYSFQISSYDSSGNGGGSMTFHLKKAARRLTVGIDPASWASVEGGDSVTTGHVSCDARTTVLMNWRISQTRNGRQYNAYGSAEINCAGSSRWMGRASGAAMAPGRAHLDLWASLPDPAVAPSEVSRTIIIRTCTQTGTLGRDTMAGTFRSDRICSLSGNDVILGKAGNDILRPFDGNDRVFGGPGKDLLRGGLGRDHLLGGKAPDRIKGDEGPDVLIGGKGYDVCIGGPGHDVFKSCEVKKQ